MSPMSECDIVPLNQSDDHLLEETSVDIVAVNNGYTMTDDPRSCASLLSTKQFIKLPPHMNRQPPQGRKQVPVQVHD